ncbi:MAG: hypothetical protein QF733_09910 [Phycisphaerales bacterium]|jgi:hypothetical protein|nr:hypothetical protein [Phycisphaerales bacterium]
MKGHAMETWGFIGSLLVVSAVSFVVVRFVATGPSEDAVEYMAAMLEPPASAPPVVIRSVAPSVIASPAITHVASSDASSAASADPAASAAPTSFVDTLRSGHAGLRSYDRSQLRANP